MRRVAFAIHSVDLEGQWGQWKKESERRSAEAKVLLRAKIILV